MTAPITLESLFEEATKESRVCPQSEQWNEFWQLLPDRRRAGAGWEPPLPLILGAWWNTSDSEKRERFCLHLRWAHEHGAAEIIHSFMTGMKPQDWYRGSSS